MKTNRRNKEESKGQNKDLMVAFVLVQYGILRIPVSYGSTMRWTVVVCFSFVGHLSRLLDRDVP